jgi:hypothetical protein
MKKFIALSLLAFATLQALACGGWVRPNYYMFSVFNRTQMENTYQQEANKFWSSYVGDNFYDSMVEELSNVDPKEFDKSTNGIIVAAKNKRDTEMLTYLRLLNKYLNNNGAGDTEWNYPTKAQLANRKMVISQVKKQAMAYRGSKLKNQYALLVMRCNMTEKAHQANINYWNNTASKFKDSPYKNWMKDIYAGALYNTGQKDKACEIYAELGDMTSIKYCMRKKRNLKGIKEEYAANPNSPTLTFLVQDFVNNTQETLDNNSDPEIMKYVEATGIYQNDIDGFIDFAGQVLKDGKTKSPSMWEAARGFVNYMAGHQDDAIKQLTNAQNLGGTQRMKDNARACLMLASIKSAEPTDEFFNYMLGEYKWLDKVAGVTETEKYGTDPHYVDVYERVTYDNLVPKLFQWGKTNTAVAVLGMACQHAAFSDEYSAVLDRNSSSQFEEFYNYINTKPNTEFEKFAISKLSIEDNMFNDMMGTKLLREGEFQAAVNYLDKVPLSYISEQGIAYYMARKDYNIEPWMQRQFMSPWKETETQVKTNAKLQYCRDMLNLDKQLANATGEERNQLLYKKAAMLYQASFKGDCWYLTHYAQSVNDEQQSNEFDFISTARLLLRDVEKNTTSPDLSLKSIFAQTFITGENMGYCFNENYDWNTEKTTYTLIPEGPHYRAMTRLVNYRNQFPETDAPYFTKCGIVKRFVALNK